MAYCTITDVNSYVPQSPFTPTTTPTQAQVQAYIDQVANQINMSLGNLGYVVPVANAPLSLIELKKANAWGALGLAQQSRITAIAPDQAVGLSVWTKMLNNWLEALADPKNPYELSDAPRTTKAPIKPLGEMTQSAATVSVDNGTGLEAGTYLNTGTKNYPFYIGMKF